MKIEYLHSFDVAYREASALQESLREKLILRDAPPRVTNIVAGADVSYARNSDFFFAAVVLLSYPAMQVVEEAYATKKTSFPYIPGLLSFREGPALLEAFAQLRQVPDVVIFDGQGIAHPRGMGLAAHMGLFLNIPTIGCAKSRLWGHHAAVGERAGDSVPLTNDGEIIGAVVRTRTRVKPVFVSPGNFISRERAVEVVLACCRGYRLPEPVRKAHLAVNRFRLAQHDH